MRLKPLKQWICDNCEERIEKPGDGWLEWLVDKTESPIKGQPHYHGFKIVHHLSSSPKQPFDDCYYYKQSPEHQLHMGAALADFLGQHGLIRLLMFIHSGPVHEKQYSGPHVKDCKEWAEIFRRLNFPYYEEARYYMTRARDTGFLNQFNEITCYLPETLKEVIKRYES